MLLRLESLLPFSVSPPLAGENIVELGDILLGFDSCTYYASLPDSWDSRFLRLGSPL